MCDRNPGEIVTLAYLSGFGSVTRCACGTVSLHVGGVSIRMEQMAFLQTADMCREALLALAQQMVLPPAGSTATLH